MQVLQLRCGKPKKQAGFMSEIIELWLMLFENQTGQELTQMYVVNEGSVAWISSDRTQDKVCGYTGLTSWLNHLQTNPLPRQLNSTWLDLFGFHQRNVTSLWDFSPQRLKAAVLPVHDLGTAGMRTSDRQPAGLLVPKRIKKRTYFLLYVVVDKWQSRSLTICVVGS